MTYRTATIGNIASIQTGPFGSQLHNRDYILDGTPIVTVEHLGQRKMTRQNLPCVSDTDKQRLSKYILKYGDLVFSRVGSVDRCSWVGEEEAGWMFSGRCLRVRPNDPNEIYHKFLYYYFCLDSTKDYVRNIAVGATMPSINTRLLSEVPIKFPDIEKQRQIGDTLTALDEQIEGNEKINHHLEQIAQAIFKSWFVDFEPWGGVMPSDWRQYELGDFFPVKTGKMNANVSSDIGEYPFFSCSRDIAWTDQYSFDGKAILVAGNGEFNVKWYDGKFEAYQRTYVLMPSDSSLFAFLYYVTKDGLAKITSNARGSVIRFITKGNIENYSFFAPSHLQKLVVIDMFASINKQIENNIREISILSSVRDTLLPRLLSGELSVSDLPDVK